MPKGLQGFQKGHKVNNGRKRSKVTIEKCRARMKGKHWKIKDTSNMGKYNGMRHWNWKGGKSKCIDCGKSLSGKKYKRCIVCSGKSKSGENSPSWIKDRVLIKRYDRRNDPTYKSWRTQVYRRDSFKCRITNLDCQGRLEAHHILSWKNHPELRYEVNNGIILCHFHHPRKRMDEIKLIQTFTGLVMQKN